MGVGRTSAIIPSDALASNVAERRSATGFSYVVVVGSYSSFARIASTSAVPAVSASIPAKRAPMICTAT